MNSRRVLVSSCLGFGLALAAAAFNPTSAMAVACESGTAKGVWELPSGSGTSDGFIDGFLFLSISPTSAPRYFFNATLTDVPSPCLSCITGTIDGYLDDGFGPAPDYVVHGTYSGLFLSGKGSFTCEVFPPTGTHAVGKIKGTFSDPPASSLDGTFKGDWEICP